MAERGRLSALHIRKACEESLRRLQTDHIDLYQMHHVDRETPWEEIWQAMEQLVREGKVLYVGSSNFAGWQIARANEVAAARNFLGLVSEQSLYNLTERTLELEVIPACEAYGLGVIPWSPLAGGLLGGALEDAGAPARRSMSSLREKVERYQATARALRGPVSRACRGAVDVALAWLLANPVVTAPIIGPRTVDQLDGAIRAAGIDLEADALRQLDEIFPGPGGPAPEAYAW